MYYNPPPQSSPAITHKLSNHHDVWTRAHHHALGGTSNGVMPPHHSASSYAVFNMQNMQHHPPNGLASHAPIPTQHHHQNSLSSYSSPPNGVTHQSQHGLAQSSPTAPTGQVMSQHWQQQLLKYDVSQNYIPQSTSIFAFLGIENARVHPEQPTADVGTLHSFCLLSPDIHILYPLPLF